jgi:hypothetical protein
MIEKPKRVNRPEKCGWYAIDLEDGVIVTRSVPMYKWSEAKAEAWDLDAKFIGYYDGVSWDDIELTSYVWTSPSLYKCLLDARPSESFLEKVWQVIFFAFDVITDAIDSFERRRRNNDNR